MKLKNGIFVQKHMRHFAVRTHGNYTQQQQQITRKDAVMMLMKHANHSVYLLENEEFLLK